MPKPPDLDAALAAVERSYKRLHHDWPFKHPRDVKGGEVMLAFDKAMEDYLRALAAQPERVGVPEEVLALAKQMLSFHDLSAAGSWCSTCQHKWPCPTMTFARFILAHAADDAPPEGGVDMGAKLDRFRHAEVYRVSTYISDERHVYKGPRHRRRAEALDDLARISDALDDKNRCISAAAAELDALRERERKLREALAHFKLEGDDLFVRSRTGEPEYPWVWECVRMGVDGKVVHDLSAALTPSKESSDG